MTEREKMLAGALYRASDPELVALRLRARQLTGAFNQSEPTAVEMRRNLLAQLFGSLGAQAEIEPDFRCDYGVNIHAGDNLFMNFNCVILDVCRVDIGDSVFLAPGVHVYTAEHPIDAAARTSGVEMGRPVRIGNRVWLGGGAIILPGVTIGDDTVIGAGSVVTRDIPAGVVAAGNPCRVLRRIAESP